MKKVYLLVWSLMCFTLLQAQEQTVITTAPDGVVKNLMRSSVTYNLESDVPTATPDDGYASEVVFAADGNVYIKDIITAYAFDTYVKGSMKDNVITVKLPQPIIDLDGQLVYIDQLIESEEDGIKVYTPVGKESELLFDYQDGSLIQKDANFIFGLTLGGEALGAADRDLRLIDVKDQPASLPDGTACQTWKMRDWSGTITDVQVAINGNDIYLGGLTDGYFENDWVKGSIQGKQVVFPSHQYYGLLVTEYSSAYLYYLAADIDSVYNELWGEYEYFYVPTEAITFDYDAEKQTISSKQTMLVNIGPNYVNYAFCYDEPYIIHQKELTHATRPLNPSITNFMDYTEMWGYGAMSFTLPLEDVEGNILNENNIYYNVYVDDELFTFNPDEYMGLEESMTDIPYSFADSNYDIQAYGASHSFTFFLTGYERIGVQSIHKIGDEVAKSDIVYSDGTATAIRTATQEDAECVSETYTDLSGRRVAVPSKGLYIRSMKMSDGSICSMKIMK